MARAWHLISRPDGLPTAENFELRDHALPELGAGMVRLRNLFLSVDPYMRGRMNEAKSYIPPFALDAPMEGGAIGEVVESNAEDLSPGDLVVHMAGWRDEAVVPAKAVQKAPRIPGVEPQAFLGVLGMPGATAYFGLLDAALARHGDIVFVSAAAGAVGSAVVQMARAKGMTVIGSARGAAKCDFVRSLGADTVVDYTKANFTEGAQRYDLIVDNVASQSLCAVRRARTASSWAASAGCCASARNAVPCPMPATATRGPRWSRCTSRHAHCCSSWHTPTKCSPKMNAITFTPS